MSKAYRKLPQKNGSKWLVQNEDVHFIHSDHPQYIVGSITHQKNILNINQLRLAFQNAHTSDSEIFMQKVTYDLYLNLFRNADSEYYLNVE